MDKYLETLMPLKGDDEKIVCFWTYGSVYSPYYFIAPADADDRSDVTACIEDTLHRLLEAGIDDGMIDAILCAGKEEDADKEFYDENAFVAIDLGYVLYDSIIHVNWSFVPEESEAVF